MNARDQTRVRAYVYYLERLYEAGEGIVAASQADPGSDVPVTPGATPWAKLTTEQQIAFGAMVTPDVNETLIRAIYKINGWPQAEGTDA